MTAIGSRKPEKKLNARVEQGGWGEQEITKNNKKFKKGPSWPGKQGLTHSSNIFKE